MISLAEVTRLLAVCFHSLLVAFSLLFFTKTSFNYVPAAGTAGKFALVRNQLLLVAFSPHPLVVAFGVFPFILTNRR